MSEDKIASLTGKLLAIGGAEKGSIEMGFRSESESYFSQPGRAEYSGLSQIPFENKQAMIDFLASFWGDGESINDLVLEIIELAYQMKSIEKDQEADLSPFVYTLF